MDILNTNDVKLKNSIETIQSLYKIHKKITVKLYDENRDSKNTYSRQSLKYRYDLSWNELKTKLGIELSQNIYNNNFEVMLEDTKETYYWAGFLFADGSISKDHTSLNMRLGQQDFDHTVAFRNFIEYTGKQVGRDISISSNYIKPFSEKFGIINNKSHNCLDYSFYKQLPYDLWVSWFIGYTDGDGSICARKDRVNLFNIRYVAHISNLSFHEELLEDIKRRIDTCNSSIYLDGETIIRWRLAKKSIARELKYQSQFLPVLARKWDKIKLHDMV